MLLLIASGFAFDALTPRGVADWVLYLAPIALSSRIGPTWFPFAIATLCSALTVIGFFVSPTGMIGFELALLNRILALLAMWTTAAVFRRGRLDEEALLDSIAQLRHEDRLKTLGRLAAGVAHELGTPLNVISATADFIQLGALSHEITVENAAIIKNQTERMALIIQQLLHFARRHRPSKLVVDLREVVRQTLSLIGPLAKKEEVTLLPSLGNDPLIARVDFSQIQQALSNLVLNGIQATDRGGCIEVALRQVTVHPPGDDRDAPREHACISVVDEGEGILPENLDHVFEPFFTTKDTGQGTGLGLSIAYGIVSEHGGWITVESERAKGSRFTIHLPLEE
jgi:signal transduction histidine kinase